jgi:hypothetical protein
MIGILREDDAGVLCRPGGVGPNRAAALRRRPVGPQQDVGALQRQVIDIYA